jgi:hypothetical protein
MSDPNTSQHEKLVGVADYERALSRLLTRPQRVLRIFDRQLDRFIDTPANHQLLRTFLTRSRASRLHIVLHDSSTLTRDCPRLVGLLRQFAHAIAIHETEAHAKGVYDPFLVVDDRDHLHRFHYEDSRALLVLDDPPATSVFLERFAELWEASYPAVSGTTLGL